MVWGNALNRDEQIKSQIKALVNQLNQNSIESMFLISSFLPVTSESAVSIGDALQNNTSLKELYLSGHNLGLDGCKSIGNAISKQSKLKKVSVGHAEIGEDHEQLRELLNGIFKSKSIDHLDLSKRSFSANSLEIMNECFDVCVDDGASSSSQSPITSLDLCQNAIDDQSLSVLAKFLVKSNVKTLNLAINTFTPSGFASFVQTLIQHRLPLEKLQLTGNNIADEGAIQLAKMIAQNNGLVDIEINDCQIGAEGARALGSALITWNGQHFAASDNPKFSKSFSQGFQQPQQLSSDSAAVDGAAALEQSNSSQLRSLVLRGCHLEDEGISLVVESIISGRLPNLNLLDVAFNSLSVRSLEMLGGVITVDRCAQLEILDVSCNSLGEESVELIGKWLNSNKLTTLKCLSLNNIDVGVDSLKQLCKYLIKYPNSSLRVIEAMGNNNTKNKEISLEKLNTQEQEYPDQDDNNQEQYIDNEFLDILDQLYEDTEIDLKWK